MPTEAMYWLMEMNYQIDEEICKRTGLERHSDEQVKVKEQCIKQFVNKFLEDVPRDHNEA